MLTHPPLFLVSSYINTSLVYESLNAVARITNTSMFVIVFSQNKFTYRTSSLLFTDEATTKNIQRESSMVEELGFVANYDRY